MSEGDILYIESPISIRFKAQLGAKKNKSARTINFSLVLYNIENVPIFNVTSEAKLVTADIVEATCNIPPHFLNDEYYSVRILLVEDVSVALFDLHDIVTFKLEEKERPGSWHGKWIGLIRPQKFINWEFKTL
jgi:lipopolysaccharide transport system ATP-binding protein